MGDIEYPETLAAFVGTVLRKQRELAEECLRQPGAAELVALGWSVKLDQKFSEDLTQVFLSATLQPPPGH